LHAPTEQAETGATTRSRFALVQQARRRLQDSYYFDRHGHVPFRASPSIETIWRSARFDLGDYRYEPPPLGVTG
jgi:hypothetical protein